MGHTSKRDYSSKCHALPYLHCCWSPDTKDWNAIISTCEGFPSVWPFSEIRDFAHLTDERALILTCQEEWFTTSDKEQDQIRGEGCGGLGRWESDSICSAKKNKMSLNCASIWVLSSARLWPILSFTSASKSPCNFSLSLFVRSCLPFGDLIEVPSGEHYLSLLK